MGLVPVLGAPVLGAPVTRDPEKRVGGGDRAPHSRSWFKWPMTYVWKPIVGLSSYSRYPGITTLSLMAYAVGSEVIEIVSADGGHMSQNMCRFATFSIYCKGIASSSNSI